MRVMVDAHMDEVGLLITDIDNSGMLKFTNVGGFDDRALLGKVVQVGPKKATGVIGARASGGGQAEDCGDGGLKAHRDSRYPPK